MENTKYDNSLNPFNPIKDNDEFDFRDLLEGLIRKKNWFIFVAGIILSGSIGLTIFNRIYKPVFRGSFSLLIMDPMNPNQNVNNSTEYNINSSFFKDIAANSNNYEINTLITFLKSPIFLEPISREFNISVEGLKRSISIDQASDSAGSISKGVLNISFNFNNKKIGKKILETLANAYLKASLEQKQKRLNEGLRFLNEQSPKIQKRKDTLETKLVLFREKNKLIQPSAESGSIIEQKRKIEQTIINLTNEKNRLKDVRSEIKDGTITARGFQKEIGDGLSISDFDQGLLQQLINVENELAEAKSKYTLNSSIVLGLNQRLAQIQPLLLKNQLEAVDTALKLNSGSLISAQNLKIDLEKRFELQPALIKQYENIEQELQIANENLLSLIAARESFQLEMAQNTIPWRLISNPQIQDKPIKPDIGYSLSIGTLFAILIGSLVAIIRDKQDHVFYSPNEVNKSLNTTILGHLPHVDMFTQIREEKKSILEVLKDDESKKDPSKIDSYQRFFFQEAFRNLYTSIRFLNTNKEVNTILLTSSLPKEGKTLTNILLAKTLADLGVKVLLIDADLRKPQIHFRLGLNNLLGLSNLLIDSKLEPDDVISKIQGYDNWNVITGGTIPPDPTRILGSQRYKDLINELKESKKYEFILIDSPPVLGLADSLLISESIDGVVILIGLMAVDRSLPKETINRIKSGGANFYGVVTNQTKKEKVNYIKKYGYGKYTKGYGYNSYKTYGSGAIAPDYSVYQSYSKEENENNIESQDDSQDGFNLESDSKRQLKNVLDFIKSKFEPLITWLEK